MIRSDEERFVDLNDQYHQSTDDATRQRLEGELFALVDANLRRALKPLIARTFGPGVYREGDSLQFTAYMNEFFTKVLDRRSDGFWQARTLTDLRRYASVAITNLMRDYIKRKAHGEVILRELAPLVEDRQQRFRDRFRFELDDSVFTLLEGWRTGEDPKRRLMADFLTHRYIDGMSYDDIARQLGLETKAAYRLRDEAIRTLQKVFES